MIPNQWYAILESNQVKLGKPVGVTRMGEKLVVWRDSQGKISCMRDLCPHRGVALSAGKIINNCIQCPFHGFEYDISGRCQLIPANGRKASIPKAFQVKTYPIREAHNFIYIWWGEARSDLPPVPFFDSIDDRLFSYQTLHDHWSTHYSRAIENQLDVVHLPFIHYNTIGRGNRALINGPLWRVEEKQKGSDILSIWVYNEVDQGQIPLKPDQIPEPQRSPFLQFIFPNLWQNWISNDMRIVIAFTPVDNENTMMYIRYYQNMVRAPILRNIFNLFGTIGNLVIERQDKRVVITQSPKRSDLRGGEKLIQGDGPIIEYRRRRQALIDSAAIEPKEREVIARS